MLMFVYIHSWQGLLNCALIVHLNPMNHGRDFVLTPIKGFPIHAESNITLRK